MSDVPQDNPARPGYDGEDSAPATASVQQTSMSSRRALIASAVSNIQIFKQSWKSIMFLKAGVGLGQVLALIILLVLASILPSPLYPSIKQSERSDACPNPGLFQAWMIVQIFRLVICWSVSCWVAIRAQRALRRERSLEDQHEARMSSVSPSPTQPRLFGSQPSLTHSVSTGSGTTLAAMSSAVPERNGSPPAVYTPTMQSSSATVDVLAATNSKDLEAGIPHMGLNSIALYPASAAEVSRPSLQQAREYARDYQSEVTGADEIDEPSQVGLAARIDRSAPFITKLLGLISLVLFVFGNVLLFYPLPSNQETCYHSAPMLWWGVMTVTGVGWFLLGQVLFVVLFVGIGGQAVLAVLRRLHIVPTPVEPEPPRPPQPEPLSHLELARVPIVCFVPHPGPASAPASPTETKSMADAQSQPLIVKLDWTRFPHPAHYLKPNKALCAICQENFTEPREVKRILYDAEPLRLLGCGHVYHTACIDKWLLEKSGICPFCNTDIRSTLVKEKSEEAATEPRRSWFKRDSSISPV